MAFKRDTSLAFRVTRAVAASLATCAVLVSSLGCSEADAPMGPGSPNVLDASEPKAQGLIAAHVRKLTNAEYEEAVRDLLGEEILPLVPEFADDTKNGFYTRNVEQAVDETRGEQLTRAAHALARAFVATSAFAANSCSRGTDSRCITRFIEQLSTRAFRRPVTPEEVLELQGVYDTAREGGSFEDGFSAVLAAVLSSASFLYVPSLGIGDENIRTLDGYEIASALSFFLIGAPPDEALLRAAKGSALTTSEGRASHVDRLLREDPRARRQMRRFFREWLGIDRLELVSKASVLDFARLRALFDAETDAVLNDVLERRGARLSSLLAGDLNVDDSVLQSHYGLTELLQEEGEPATHATPLVRRGILTRGAFLSVFSSADHSSPVKRGAALLSRLLCRSIALPTGELAARAADMPPASEGHTTRARFVEHASDPTCRACHETLDPLGFAFEHFDETGRFRSMENGEPIDASGVLRGTDVDGPFHNAEELMRKLSQSEDVQRCFARNVVRFATGRTDAATEDRFLVSWEALPASARDNALLVMRAFVADELFVLRRAP